MSAFDLLERFFELDYTKRITAKEALEHPYLSELHNVEDEVSEKSYSSLCEPPFPTWSSSSKCTS
jgi:serine/threonine protein kinase